MYYIVYETLNLITGRPYRGAHSTDYLEDGYIGSGFLLEKALKKYGRENFGRSILFMAFDKESMYWAESILVSEEWIEESNAYNLRKGGIGGLSEVSMQKIRDTNLDKYGCEYSLASPFIRNKIEETNFARYGSITPLANAEVREKILQTVETKYQVSNVMQVEEVKQANYETNLARRGVKRPAQSKEVQEKTAATFMARYGVSTMSQIPEVKKKISEAVAGEKHPLYDMKWVHNPGTYENARVPTSYLSHLKEGWIVGRHPSGMRGKYTYVSKDNVRTILTTSLD